MSFRYVLLFIFASYLSGAAVVIAIRPTKTDTSVADAFSAGHRIRSVSSLAREGIADPPVPGPRLSHDTSFVVFPADCNGRGDMLFGGKILAEMDRSAAIAVRRFLYDAEDKTLSAVTAAASAVKFVRPGKLNDLLFVRAKVISAKDKFVQVRVAVERESDSGRTVETVADCDIVFVTIDAKMKRPAGHGLVFPKKEKE